MRRSSKVIELSSMKTLSLSVMLALPLWIRVWGSKSALKRKFCWRAEPELAKPEAPEPATVSTIKLAGSTARTRPRSNTK
jgi:hypothetical protein